jgi:hypothetical protein
MALQQQDTDETTYFANKSSLDTAEILEKKINDWNNIIERNRYLEKVRRCWAAYYGANLGDISAGHEITFTGEQEEFLHLPVNHFRNIASHMLEMTTSSRPAYEARAVNTDYKSLAQTLVADGVLDYYLREKKLEDKLKRAVEYAIVLGSGYIKLGWDAMAGEIYDYDEEGNPMYEGDVIIQNLSPFDVVVDGSKETSDENDWILTRTFKNKYDLIAKYPQFESEILAIRDKTDQENYRFMNASYDKTDDVSLFEFYHRRTEAVPNGRYMIFCTGDTVFMDMDMPYRQMPVYRVSPSDIMGTPYGYTIMFDLIPLQEILNVLYSAVATNNNAFAVQSILNPRGNDVSLQQMGGMNFIDYNANIGKPEPMQLTASSGETYNFLDRLVKDMETLSGINSVTRGNPEASLKSGTSLAMVQSMAIQFISGLQNSYVRLCENVGTGLIKMLQDFATTERAITMISGKSKRSYVREFSNKDISNIARVQVSIANPLSRTTAGRVEMARDLLQMGAIKTPQEYLMVMNTGQIELMFESDQKQNMLIRQENERMMDKEPVACLFTDEHKQHILEHRELLSDPDLRMDPQLTKLVGDHIQEHFTMLQEANPNMLMLLGQQPIQPPPPPAPPAPPGPPPGPPQGPQMGAPGPMPGPMGPPPNAGPPSPPAPMPPQGPQGPHNPHGGHPGHPGGGHHGHPQQPGQGPQGGPGTSPSGMAPANQFVLPNGSSRVTGPGIENGVSLPNLPKNPLGLPINPADNLQS